MAASEESTLRTFFKEESLVEQRFEAEESKRRAAADSLCNGKVTPWDARKMLEADVFLLSEELWTKQREHTESLSTMRSQLDSVTRAKDESGALLRLWESQMIEVFFQRAKRSAEAYLITMRFCCGRPRETRGGSN